MPSDSEDTRSEHILDPVPAGKLDNMEHILLPSLLEHILLPLLSLLGHNLGEINQPWERKSSDDRL